MESRSVVVKYKRVLLKLSGEALMGSQPFGLDPFASLKIAEKVKELVDLGVQVGIVIGGGNFFRGALAESTGLARIPADQMGMLATVINAVALQQSFSKLGVDARVMSAVGCQPIAEPHSPAVALAYLAQGAVLIFAGGTGNPFFTTDSAAALRASETGAEILIKATKVDGIYNKDPKRYPDAVKYPHISYSEVFAKQLGVMDMAAFAICRENRIPILVLNMFEDHSLRRAVLGENVGTFVEGD
jgi:uridylate kinase